MAENTKNNIDEIINNSFKLAKDFYLADAKHDGTVLIFGESDNPDNTAMWEFSFADDADREQQLGAFGLIFRHRNIKRYVVMTLAWMSEFSSKATAAPKRIETMIVSYSDSNNIHKVSTNAVVRDSSGALIDIVRDPNNHGEDVKVMGIFCQILNFKYQPDILNNDDLLSACEIEAGKSLVHGEIRLPGTNQHKNASPKAH